MLTIFIRTVEFSCFESKYIENCTIFIICGNIAKRKRDGTGIKNFSKFGALIPSEALLFSNLKIKSQRVQTVPQR
jgi:hypothetical protein